MITNKTSPCSDMKSNRLFTKCKFVLAIHVLYLLSLSLSTSWFPSDWKIIFMTLIKKENDLSTFIPYSIIPKIFESIVYKKMHAILVPIFKDDQHRFLEENNWQQRLID